MTNKAHAVAGATCTDPPPLTASLRAAIWLLMITGFVMAFTSPRQGLIAF